MEVTCAVDGQRRRQLRWHHTGTHIIYAASRRVLGPHVWQQGAKKTPMEAHLDISHYQSLTDAEEQEIERMANEIVRQGAPIKKYMMNKPDAEKAYGFLLYQGGAIPGNSLRIVNIDGVDVEACCGTHCDNTSEIGFIRLLKSQRISDGVVRLTFVAGDRAYEELKKQTSIVNELCTLWGIEQTMVVQTAERFFKDYKRLTAETKEQDKSILDFQVKLLLANPSLRLGLVLSDQPDPTLYFSNLDQHANALKVNRAFSFRAPRKASSSWASSSSLESSEIRRSSIPECSILAFSRRSPLTERRRLSKSASKTKSPSAYSSPRSPVERQGQDRRQEEGDDGARAGRLAPLARPCATRRGRGIAATIA